MYEKKSDLYEDIGGKIKGLARWMFYLGAALSGISGLIAIVNGADYGDGLTVLVGLITIAVGTFLSWVGSWVLYGFGELIDNTASIKKTAARIEKNTRPEEKPFEDEE